MARGARPRPSAAAPAARAGRPRPLGDDERSVSDVLGSILMVGITVLMAAAFGGILLTYDGPDDAQHTQIFVSVGPGADGDWGTNDAELILRHIGGEPLFEDDVTVTYTDTSGTHTTTPTFTGGRLDIGDEWVQVISASPGNAVSVDVVVDQDGGAALLSSGSVAAGGTGAILTYLSSLAPSSGSVANLANAQSAADSNAAATLTEGSVGGTPSAVTVAATSASNSGASNNNVLLSDDVRSTLDNSGEWVQATGFTAPSGYAVSALSIGMEARAVQAVSTVTHVATITGTATSGSSVSTLSTIPISTGDVYIASIANGNTPLRTVTGVSGPSGVTWTLVGTQTNSAGNGELEVWVGTGTPTLIGVVTATFSGAIDRAAIAVSRYSGADTSSPVQASLAGEAAGNGGTTTVSLGTVAGTATTGIFYAALNGIGASGSNPCSFTTPVNERADFDPGGNKVQLCTAGGTAAASNSLSATLGSSGDWQAILLTLRPYSTPLPSVKMTFTFAGCTCATSLTQALTTSDAQYTQSIISDKTSPGWALSDLSGITVRVTYTTDSGSDVQVDRIYLGLTYTTTPTTFTTQADLSFAAVPDTGTQVFQMRYKVTGDTFNVYALTGAVERLCPGTLSSAVYAVFTCTLSPGEYAGGSPVLRIKDVTTGGTAQGIMTIEYARMSSG